MTGASVEIDAESDESDEALLVTIRLTADLMNAVVQSGQVFNCCAMPEPEITGEWDVAFMKILA